MSTPQSSPGTGAKRSEKIRAIVKDCLVDRVNGQVISDESLIQSHPDLMPELADELRNLRRIEQAERKAEEPETSGLHIRCPHCHNPVELVDDASLSEVLCSSCGSKFSLVDDSPRTYQASSQQTIGHFQLLDKVGIGAFGSVWSARDTELDRQVAVKIPRKGQLSPEDGELFIREARAAAQLKHPHIVSVLEVGRHEDRIYIVTEFVQGLDLADWLTDQQTTPREAAEVCATMADALQHAHDHGVIHRDIKPSNIMLDTAGEPHLMDFGLAKRESGEMTMTVEGKLIGTPAYMSPEQARGAAHDADARSDVYSLGVILFELLTGERPFRGSARMVLHQVLVEDAPSPRKLNSQVPKDLETICLKCLEKAPDRRYLRAGDLRDDLRRFLRAEPVEARPITKVARAWRWCQRKPVVAGLGTIVACLLLFLSIAGPLVAVHQSSLAEQEADARSQLQRESESRRRLLYSADMRLAEADWLAGDVDSVLNLLERHNLQADQEDLRGFEWYYLWENCRRSIMVPRLPAGEVADVIFSPDGQAVTTTSSSVRSSQAYVDIKSWDTLKLNQLDERSIPLKGIRIQKMSPDGKLVAIGHSEGNLTLLNSSTGEMRELSGLDHGIASLAFSPDGNALAAGGDGGSVKIWNVCSGNELAPIEPHNDRVYSVAFSPKGKILASGSRGENRMAKLSDVETGKVLLELDHRPFGSVWSIAFSPDGMMLATGTSGAHLAIVWNVQTGEQICRFSHTNYVWAVAFSPDGRKLASAGGDQRIRLWDVESGGLEDILNENEDYARAIAFSPDGTVLASPGEFGGLKLWQVGNPSGGIVLEGHDDNVDCVLFSPDGRTLASASSDATVTLWDAVTGTERFCLDGNRLPVRSVSIAFSPTGEVLASACPNSTVKLWDVATGQLIDKLTHMDAAEITTVAYSPSGQLLATGRSNGTVSVWNLASSEEVSTVKAHPYQIQSLVFSPDRKTLATSCQKLFATNEDPNVRLWDVESLELRNTIRCYSPVASLAYSVDGRLLALGRGDGKVEVWDVVNKTKTHSMRRASNVSSLVFSKDGKSLISVGEGDVDFWDTGSGELRFKLTAHRDGIFSVAISPDGRTIATGSADDTVKLWRAATEDEVHQIRQRWQQIKRTHEIARSAQ